MKTMSVKEKIELFLKQDFSQESVEQFRELVEEKMQDMRCLVEYEFLTKEESIEIHEIILKRYRDITGQAY